MSNNVEASRGAYESNNVEASRSAYNQMAEYYFTLVDSKPFNADYERPATLALLPSVEGKRVLDAGCAAGWYTKWLLERGAVVTALDYSPKMIEMTRKRVGDAADIRQADLSEPLNFLADGSFDLIISSLTLHYIKDWRGVMSEFARILRPGGHLVFSVHHPFMDFTYFKRENYFLTELLEDEWSTPEGKVQVQFYRRPLHQIISQVLEAGFTLEKLDEPMPTDEFKRKAPESYEKVTKRPQFLFIRARRG